MITALTALSLLAAAPLAPAAANDPAPVARVAYDDLNLHTAAGRAELDRRLTHAVNAVCPVADHRALALVESARACRVTANADIARQREVALAQAGEATLLIGSTGR